MIVPARPQRTDAFDVPGEHIGVFFLRVADRVHAEFAHDAGLLVGEVLQAQEVTLEVASGYAGRR